MLNSLTCLLSLVLAIQPAAPTPPTQGDAKITPLLSISTEGCDALLVAPKDQGLRTALQMLDARLLELPGEIPDFDAPPELVSLVLRLLGGPMALTVSQSSRAIPGMPLPLAAELRLTQSSAKGARSAGQEIAGWMEQFGMPLDQPNSRGAWVLPAPAPLWMGSEDSNVYVRLGLEGGVEVPSQQHLLPEGTRMAFSGMMDYGEMLALLDQVAGGDPDMDELFQMLELMGLEDLQYAWAFGTDEQRSHFVFDMPEWGAVAEESGLISGEELQPDLVALIPEDATWATAMVFDLGGIYDLYHSLAQELGDVDLDQLILEHAGLDIEKDLLEPLGSNAAVYASDATGGGGMMSTVMLVELDDTESFLRTWGRLEAFTAKVGREELEGYLRFSHFEQDGLDLGVLSFPGLPIPFELCITTVAGYAVFGVTPQAVHAAAQQITSGERGLLDNPDFQKQLSPDMSGVISISWVNTPRLMRDGYGTLSLLTSALANAARSPRDAGREPGLVMPTFNDLHHDALGILTLGRRVGDDFRSETRADRSQLVNAAGVVGYVYNSPMLALGAIMGAGMASTLVVPQVMERQVMAEQAAEPYVFDLDSVGISEEEIEEEVDYENIVAEDFVAIYSALDHYARNNGGRYPDSLQELVILDAGGARYMDPRHLVDPWGDAYLYTPPSAGNPEPLIDLAE